MYAGDGVHLAVHPVTEPLCEVQTTAYFVNGKIMPFGFLRQSASEYTSPIRPAETERDPENSRCWPKCCFSVGHRRRRWTSTKTTLGQRLVFAGETCSHYPSKRSDVGPTLYTMLYKCFVSAGKARGDVTVMCYSAAWLCLSPLWRTKPKGSICLLYKWVATAFWLFRAAVTAPPNLHWAFWGLNRSVDKETMTRLFKKMLKFCKKRLSMAGGGLLKLTIP